MPHGITLHIIQLQLPGVRNGATCVSFGSLWQLWTQSIKPSYRFQAKVALEIENARWNPVVFFNTKFHHFLVGFFLGGFVGSTHLYTVCFPVTWVLLPRQVVSAHLKELACGWWDLSDWHSHLKCWVQMDRPDFRSFLGPRVAKSGNYKVPPSCGFGNGGVLVCDVCDL